MFGNTSGQIRNVTVRNIRCGSGIAAAVGQGVQGPHSVDVEDVTVEDVNHDAGNQVLAIDFFANPTGPQLTASVSDSTIQNAFEGVLLRGNVVATFDGNVIVGPGPVSGQTFGIGFVFGADGSASGNTISNFFDSVRTEGCGVFVAADAGDVTIGANTFPDPPGNEQNVRDNRP